MSRMPTNRALPENQEHGAWPPRLQPVLELAIHPHRFRRERRHDEDEVARLIHRLNDAAPQIRAGREIGVVSEHAQRLTSSERTSDPLQRPLQPLRQQPVVVAVGEECVVTPGGRR